MPRARRHEYHHYDPRVFLEAVFRIKTSGPNLEEILPTDVVAKLARLAKVPLDELFQIGIRFATQNARAEANVFSRPVYREQYVKRLEKEKNAAAALEEEIGALLHPKDKDSTTLLASEALSNVLNLFPNLGEGMLQTEAMEKRKSQRPLTKLTIELSWLMTAVTLAKKYAPPEVLDKRSRPVAGVALTKLIARLEFAARTAGGHWTLNKNAESGTIINALEATKFLARRSFAARTPTSILYLSKNFVPSPFGLGEARSCLH
jgi:hypothetical protein